MEYVMRVYVFLQGKILMVGLKIILGGQDY